MLKCFLSPFLFALMEREEADIPIQNTVPLPVLCS